MNRLVAYLIRFAIILIGYAVAALAASAFLNIMFLASLGYTPEHAQPAATASLYFSIPFVALFVAYFAFMPAAVAILVSEILGRRDWLFYALGRAQWSRRSSSASPTRPPTPISRSPTRSSSLP